MNGFGIGDYHFRHDNDSFFDHPPFLIGIYIGLRDAKACELSPAPTLATADKRLKADLITHFFCTATSTIREFIFHTGEEDAPDYTAVFNAAVCTALDIEDVTDASSVASFVKRMIDEKTINTQELKRYFRRSARDIMQDVNMRPAHEATVIKALTSAFEGMLHKFQLSLNKGITDYDSQGYTFAKFYRAVFANQPTYEDLLE